MYSYQIRTCFETYPNTVVLTNKIINNSLIQCNTQPVFNFLSCLCLFLLLLHTVGLPTMYKLYFCMTRMRRKRR